MFFFLLQVYGTLLVTMIIVTQVTICPPQYIQVILRIHGSYTYILTNHILLLLTVSTDNPSAQLNYKHGNFQNLFYKNPLSQNKNGTGSYSFSSDNYNNGVCGQGHNLTGDIPQGNAIYDAARANIGYPWVMPTKNQCKELLDNTNHIWTSINGVTGRKFRHKTDYSKYIFFPAGGWWYNTTFDNAGAFSERNYSYGFYRSATLYSSQNSYHLFFGWDDFYIENRIVWGSYATSVCGFSIRSVVMW